MSVLSEANSIEYTKEPLKYEKQTLLSWCTPYALSIMGTPYYNNCPFGNGNGYGDGRAVSVGEVLIPQENTDGNNGTRNPTSCCIVY